MTLDQNIFLRTIVLSCKVRKIMRVMTTESDMYMFYFIFNTLVVYFFYILYFAICFFINLLTEEMLS
jgi:hypothetical protein